METRKITFNTATATVNQVTKDGEKCSFLIQNIRLTVSSIDKIGLKENIRYSSALDDKESSVEDLI